MKVDSEGIHTFDGEDWRDGVLLPPKIDPEAAFRAAFRAWNEACEKLDYMPGHGEDVQMIKRAAAERGLD